MLLFRMDNVVTKQCNSFVLNATLLLCILHMRECEMSHGPSETVTIWVAGEKTSFHWVCYEMHCLSNTFCWRNFLNMAWRRLLHSQPTVYCTAAGQKYYAFTFSLCDFFSSARTMITTSEFETLNFNSISNLFCGFTIYMKQGRILCVPPISI